MKAVMFETIDLLGHHDVVVAGGVEMEKYVKVPFYVPQLRFGLLNRKCRVVDGL